MMASHVITAELDWRCYDFNYLGNPDLQKCLMVLGNLFCGLFSPVTVTGPEGTVSSCLRGESGGC